MHQMAGKTASGHFRDIPRTRDSVLSVGGPPVSSEVTVEIINRDLGTIGDRDRWFEWSRTEEAVRRGSVVILPVNAVRSLHITFLRSSDLRFVVWI